MGYLNGKEVFPPELLEEIQRYVQGTCVYIPRCGERPKCRRKLQERNLKICREYDGGKTVRKLAETYYLSPQAIYKILSNERK